jgi:hypothetical protein
MVHKRAVGVWMAAQMCEIANEKMFTYTSAHKCTQLHTTTTTTSTHLPTTVIAITLSTCDFHAHSFVAQSPTHLQGQTQPSE